MISVVLTTEDDEVLVFLAVLFAFAAVVAAFAFGLVLLVWCVQDWLRRDKTVPYWRGPQTPLSGGRKR